MLNKLRCHAHFQFSYYLIQVVDIKSHNDWQGRSRSVGFRSQLIWIYTFCKDTDYLGSAEPGLIFLCTSNILQGTIKMQVNPCPAEPGYTLPLQTMYIQISWLLKKPTDLDLHCLHLSMWIWINNLNQVIWLAENWRWDWPLNLFSMTRVKIN